MIDAVDFKLPLPEGHPAASMIGKKVTMGIRPEDIFDAPNLAIQCNPPTGKRTLSPQRWTCWNLSVTNMLPT